MYTMKIEGDSVKIKNGSLEARWTTPIIDEKSGRVFNSQNEAAKTFGLDFRTINAIVLGKREDESVALRKATVDEVKQSFGSKIIAIIEDEPKRSKSKPKTQKEKKTAGAGSCFRVRGDGRIEFRGQNDKKWGLVCVHNGVVFASMLAAARHFKLTGDTIRHKLEKGRKGWTWATVAQVAKTWPEAVRVYANGDTRTAAAIVDDIKAEEAASFMAVTWPDGQVTVRAAVGPWSQHYPSAESVPQSVMAAAKAYNLSGT